MGEDVTDLFRSKEPSNTVVVSFRMPAVDFEVTSDAADAQGKSLSQYIRDALDVALRSSPEAPKGVSWWLSDSGYAASTQTDRSVTFTIPASVDSFGRARRRPAKSPKGSAGRQRA